MQDAEFREGSLTHPFGKAIFIFAGGVFSSFDNFQHNRDAKGFAEVKGPDLVSRLRGFVNIKGPNPMCYEVCGPGAPDIGLSWAELANRDPSFLIRRAIILRAALERTAKELIDPQSKIASVSAGVVRAFLLTRRFHHGARSLESVVTMSSLAQTRHFAVSDLPPADQLLLHLTPDFFDLVREGEIEGPVVEALAEACHEAWRALRIEHGWTHGSRRCDVKKFILSSFPTATCPGWTRSSATGRPPVWQRPRSAMWGTLSRTAPIPPTRPRASRLAKRVA